MKSEFTLQAKTVEEAYAKANDIYSSLGEISIEVINSGKKGFMGIGRVLAEIKVIVDDGKPEIKPKKQTQDKPKPQEKPQNKVQKEQPKQQNKAPKTEPRVEKKVEAPKAPTMQEKEESINVTVEEKTLAINFLKGFIKDIGFNCEVKGDLTVNEKGFVSRLITIEGEGAANLIGHRGEMLDALQYLSNLCLARKSEGDHKEYVKVIIDIENYREKREQTLRALARRMASKALKYQRNVLLEPMNPYERMIIHSEIQAIEGVSTHSVGYDDNRKIVITCENKKRAPKKQ
ncbi:MAG: KH domain-containing protein [Ruminococcaceae bacterium]|nr:KH domain-containing protein [Oscillospiraceae bacterium]